MTAARLPHNERERLDALIRYEILDTDAEELFDSIAEVAATICDVPIALISLIDKDRQWFKAKVGLDARETPREYAFCAHAILDPEELLVVPDATEDPRFSNNPLVTGAPDIRFYAGAPIVTSDHQALGTLCVIDRKERELTERQRHALQQLSKQVCANLELRLARKKLEQLNESKNRFFSILAHDLRSPIASILGIAELLVDPELNLSPEDEAKFKHHLLTSAQATHETAAGLLEMIQFEQGQFSFEPRFIKINEVIETSEKMLFGMAQKKDLAIDIACDPSIEVWADLGLLQSITQNLLSNAVKFAPAASRVSIDVETSEQSVTLSVKDTGKGIEPDRLATIFELESLYSTEGTGGEKGTGLGLTLCKQFAERLGGSLRLESKIGSGTQAYLTLPRYAEQDS